MMMRLTHTFLTQSANHRLTLCVNCHLASFFGNGKKKKKPNVERNSDVCIHHKTLHYLVQNAAWLMLCSSFERCLVGIQLWGEVKNQRGENGAAEDEQTTSKAECQPVPQSGLIVRDLKSASGETWQPWRRQRFSLLRDSSWNGWTLWAISSLGEAITRPLNDFNCCRICSMVPPNVQSCKSNV